MRISQWLIIVGYLVTLISTAQSTFLYDMDKCEGVTLEDYGDEGTMYVYGEYNQVCTWSLPPQESRVYTAILMEFRELNVDCDKGFLQMNDMNGTACALCGKYPSNTCHIYADQDKCTVSELWGATFLNYPDCIGARSVIHRGISVTPMELMTNTTLDVEFEVDYLLYKCQGPVRPGIPTLGPGKPIQHIETASGLYDLCQQIIHGTPQSVNESPKTPTTTHTDINQSTQLITPIPTSGQQTTTQPPTMKPMKTTTVTDPIMTIRSTTKLLVQTTPHTSQTSSRSYTVEISTAAATTQFRETTSTESPTAQITQGSTVLYEDFTTVESDTQWTHQSVITTGLETTTEANEAHEIYSTTAINEALEYGAISREINEQTATGPRNQPKDPHPKLISFHIIAIILSVLVAICIIVLIWMLHKKSTKERKLQTVRTLSTENEQRDTSV